MKHEHRTDCFLDCGPFEWPCHLYSLAYKLVQYVKKATQEKNWNALLGLVINLMEQAEKKFTDGATRKEWVMAMVQTSAEYINYPIDNVALGKLIDTLCDMSKIVNYDGVPTIEPEQVKGHGENE